MSIKRCLGNLAGAFALCAWVAGGTALAQGDGGKFKPEQIKAGAKSYEQNCSPCHGPRMADPQGGLDLRTFPRDQRPRFLNAVTNGKNTMPPWRDLLTPEDIDSLWAYVMAGEQQ